MHNARAFAHRDDPTISSASEWLRPCGYLKIPKQFLILFFAICLCISFLTRSCLLPTGTIVAYPLALERSGGNYEELLVSLILHVVRASIFRFYYVEEENVVNPFVE